MTETYVIDRGRYLASDLKKLMSEKIADFSRVEVKGSTVYADDEGFVDLRNLVCPDADVEFTEATFEGNLMLEGGRFSTLIFDNCRYNAVDSHTNGSETFSLGLQGIQARHLDVTLGTKTLDEKNQGVFRLNATSCEIAAHFRISRLNMVCQGGLIYLSLENARIGQTGFGGDLIIDDNCETTSGGGVILRLNRARIRGDFLFEGLNADISTIKPTPLALNASDLRVAEEMRLRNIQFLNTRPPEETPRPAVNLVRAQIGRLVLHDDIAALFPKSVDCVPWTSFESQEPVHSSQPGLAEISVGRLGFIHDSKTGEDESNKKRVKQQNKQGVFWRNFISHVSDPENHIIGANGKINSNSDIDVSKTDTGRFRRTLTEFADALSGGRAWKSSDVLRTVEKDIEIRLERRGRKWLYSSKWLGPILPCLILLLLIISVLVAPGVSLKDANSFVAVAFLFLFAAPAVLLCFPNSRTWFTEHVEYLFRRASFNAIADGISPLNVLAYVLALWGFTSIMFTAAAYHGLMAPDHTDIFHSEFELLMVQEVSDLDDVLTRGESGSNGSESATEQGNTQWFRDRSEGLFNYNLHETTNAELERLEFDQSTGKKRPEINLLKKKDQVDKFYWNIPLGAYHMGCRLNWSRPDMIEKDKWAKKIKDRYEPVTDLTPDEQTILLEAMDMKAVCERMLPAEYSMFEPALYALDVVIPLLDLRQEEQWSVRVAEPHSGERNYWAFFLVVAEAICMTIGWLFALVVAGAVTGLSDPNRRPN